MDYKEKCNLKRQITKRFKSFTKLTDSFWTISEFEIYSTNTFVHFIITTSFINDYDFAYLNTLKTILKASNFEIRAIEKFKFRVTFSISNNKFSDLPF